MKVKDLLHHGVMAVGADERASRAARLMEAAGYGALPVYDGSRLVGIISERDLLGVVAGRLDPWRIRVCELMSEDLAVADPEEPAAEAGARMAALGIRHLPVVDKGRLIGMLSVRDLLSVAADTTLRLRPARPRLAS